MKIHSGTLPIFYFTWARRWLFKMATALLGLLVSPTYVSAEPVSGHPRLWVRAADLSRLRSWAVTSNPVYKDGLAMLATQAKADMDAGRVPDQDTGGPTYVDYPSEMYAELFAFMSLISSDQATRDDYAQRARKALMYVMNRAVLGSAAGEPFRHLDFATSDRSRWQGEGFALTVDWIYSYLSSDDKVTIRKVFLRWADENVNATTTNNNHPEPIGVVNDPALTNDPLKVRWAGNNYFNAHMRNIGLMAMAMDSADDPGNTLRNYLGNATGAWLYMVDHLMRNDSRGGLFPEGFEYSPQSLGYVGQFLLALYTAGQDDSATWGSQVVLTKNPFWNDLVSAYLHSLSPATVRLADPGEVYQPAWYGDGQNYWAPDYIGVFGSLGLYDYATGNTTRLSSLRWIQTNMAPGGATELSRRARDSNFFVNAILYFMLFDPATTALTDPRPSQSLEFFSPGLGRLLARTGWGTDAVWFTYKLSWNSVDHQNGDGNQIEFYRRGEWLTKERTGYDLDAGGSNNHNTLALENNTPEHNETGDYRNINWRLGSQWAYVSSGDPKILARSVGKDYVYISGDATNLYNSTYENSTDIVHASRSVVWLKPDHIVVYDRAASKTDARFKRFWLNFPTQPVVLGNRATMTTSSGQKLVVTSLLPTNATISSEAAVELIGDLAGQEPMQFRLRVQAAGGPKSARFLHVLQGADAGVSPDLVTLVQSTSGTAFAGSLVKEFVVLFPVELDDSFTSVTYSVPATTKSHLITGLSPNARYDITSLTAGSNLQVTVRPGTAYQADSGGVLLWSQGATILTTLYFPRLLSTNGSGSATDTSEYTGIAVANLGAIDTALTFTAYDKTGALISGTNIKNPAFITLKKGEQLPTIDYQVFGTGLPVQGPVGWMKLESTAGKIVGFFLMFNQQLSILDGADVSGATLTSFVFPEIEDLGFTQLHVANPDSNTATITFDLTKSDGSARTSSVVRTVNPSGFIAVSLTDLFAGLNAEGSDYIRVSSTKGVVPFEYLGRTALYVEGLNGQDATAGATTLYCPQYLVGGVPSIYRTTLSVVNLDSTAGTVTFKFIGDDGKQIGSTRTQSIAAKGKIYITDQNFFLNAGNTSTQGYLVITSSGPKLTGSVVFGDPARTTFSTALPLVATLQSSIVFSQVASDKTYFTGVALLNPNSIAVNATIEVYDSSGSLVASQVRNIPAGQRTSKLLTEYFTGLQNRSSGYIKITADKTVAGFALFGTSTLSVLSAVPPQVVP